jgi:hypothetical protein
MDDRARECDHPNARTPLQSAPKPAGGRAEDFEHRHDPTAAWTWRSRTARTGGRSGRCTCRRASASWEFIRYGVCYSGELQSVGCLQCALLSRMKGVEAQVWVVPVLMGCP